MRALFRILLIVPFSLPSCSAQETHIHNAPEKLGKVSFPISCTPAVQERVQSRRGSASLLRVHSRRKYVSRCGETGSAVRDGVLGNGDDVLSPALGAAHRARDGFDGAKRDRASAANWDRLRTRAPVHRCARVAVSGRGYGSVPHAGVELRACDGQIWRGRTGRMWRRRCFTRSRCWRMHLLQTRRMRSRSRRPTFLSRSTSAYPEHPGIPHYLIHAYDNAELASKGLSAARAYSQIAPSAPHALHMPSHIFTRLGLVG